MSSPKIKLTYFDVGGRATAIRLAFFIGGVQFEDERLTGDKFRELKAAGAFKNGQVPVLEVDGVQHAQSLPLIVYAGKLAGIYPFDLVQSALVHDLLYTITEIYNLLSPSGSLTDQEAKKKLREELSEGALKTGIARLDALLLASKSGYLVGDSLTIADLHLFAFYRSFSAGNIDYIAKEWINQFPNLTSFVGRIQLLPKVKEFFSSGGK